MSGSWVVPTAKCTAAGEPTYSAFWVGLGGAGDTEALEQTGTETNCSAQGTASYYAWYELVPKAPVRVDLPVSAGDHISSKVTVERHERVDLAVGRDVRPDVLQDPGDEQPRHLERGMDRRGTVAVPAAR